jgi:predicted permease
MPEWRDVIRARLAGAGLQPAREAEVVEELAQHVEDRYRDAIARGLSHADATALALAEIDSPDSLARRVARVLADPPPAPPVGGPPSRRLSGLWQDVRYAARLLRRSPAFTAAAIVTVALTTGPTIAALGVANWFFLRPLPGVVESDRLGQLRFGQSRAAGSFSPWYVSYDNVAVIREGARTLQGIAGYSPDDDLTLRIGDGPPMFTQGLWVTTNVFDLLGVPVVAGRNFLPEDDNTPGGSPVTILSARAARRYFADPAAAIGKRLELNRTPFEVIGVVSDRFDGVEIDRRPELYLPGQASRRTAHLPPERWAYEPTRGPFADHIVRLAPGATFEQADAELKVLTRALTTHPSGGALFEKVGGTLVPGVGFRSSQRARVGDLVRLLLWIGLALVALGIANVANLFAFRSGRRAHESAVRRALGASAWRLARLPAIEAVIVAVAGAAIGLALTTAARAAVAGVRLPGVETFDVPLDWRLMLMVAGLAIVTGVLLGVVPSRVAARAPLGIVLGRVSRTSTRAGGWVRGGLAVTQVALSLALVIGALLFLRTLANLHAVDIGFDARGVSDVTLALRPQGYAGPRALAFQRDVLARLEADPAVEAAALLMYPPFRGARFRNRVHLPGADPKASSLQVTSNYVSSGYFQTLGLQLAAGRTFTAAETQSAGGLKAAVILSEALAVKLFGTPSAVGRIVTLPATLGVPAQDVPVVGIARDAHWYDFGAPEMLMYLPVGDDMPVGTLLVRSPRPPREVLERAQAAARDLDPSVPVFSTGTMTQFVEERMAEQRLRAWLFGVLSAIGFVLAAVGIYSLVSQAVTDRTREFGIRRAVGASTTQVVQHVLRQAAIVIAIGVPIGVAIAVFGSRLIEGQLFGVAPTSPVVYATAALGLGAVVLLACVAPARRATRVDPAHVLRE